MVGMGGLRCQVADLKENYFSSMFWPTECLFSEYLMKGPTRLARVRAKSKGFGSYRTTPGGGSKGEVEREK